MARFVWPESIWGFFPYVGAGVTVFFYEQPDSKLYSRDFGGLVGAGVFTQLTDGLRLRFEGRDHIVARWNRHHIFATVSLVTLYR